MAFQKTVTLSNNIDAILNMERNKYGTILAVIHQSRFPGGCQQISMVPSSFSLTNTEVLKCNRPITLSSPTPGTKIVHTLSCGLYSILTCGWMVGNLSLCNISIWNPGNNCRQITDYCGGSIWISAICNDLKISFVLMFQWLCKIWWKYMSATLIWFLWKHHLLRHLRKIIH